MKFRLVITVALFVIFLMALTLLIKTQTASADTVTEIEFASTYFDNDSYSRIVGTKYSLEMAKAKNLNQGDSFSDEYFEEQTIYMYFYLRVHNENWNDAQEQFWRAGFIDYPGSITFYACIERLSVDDIGLLYAYNHGQMWQEENVIKSMVERTNKNIIETFSETNQ